MQTQNIKLPTNTLHSLVAALVCFPFANALPQAANIYVSDAVGIEKFDSGGNRSVFAGFGSSQPYGLAFDGTGSLYAAVWTYGDPFSGTIQKLDSSGVAALFASTLGFPRFPASLAFGSSGDLYVAVQGAGVINKIDTSGSVSIFASGLGFYPAGLGFDISGNLYVGDNGTIEKFDPNGNRSTFASGLNVPFNGLYGLAFGSNGNFYVAENGRIDMFDLNGNRSTFASGLNGPRGLAFDSSGNLYAAIAGSGIVEKFDPSGNGSVFATGLNDPTFIAVQTVPEPSPWAMAALAASALCAGHRLRCRWSQST